MTMRDIHTANVSRSSPYDLTTSGLAAAIVPGIALSGADVGMKKRERLWFTRYQELCQYAAETGSCLVPQKHKDNPSLGLWVKKQRAQYKLYMENKPSSITKERIALLERVGFQFNAVPEDWQARFEELKDFKEHHGDCLVPQQFQLNPSLGIWVNHQRTQYKLVKENKPSYLTESRIKMLEDLGFEWSAVNAKWRSRFMELEAHMKKYPGKIPCKKTNRSLHQWVTYQRKLYQQKRCVSQVNDNSDKGKQTYKGASNVSGHGLTREREEMLDSLGFPWVEEDEGSLEEVADSTSPGVKVERALGYVDDSEDQVSVSVSSLLMLKKQAPLRSAMGSAELFTASSDESSDDSAVA